MLLTIDIGNTHTKYGLWNDTTLHAVWRTATDAARTPDECAAALWALFGTHGVPLAHVRGVCAASVVPAATAAVLGACASLFPACDPVQVTANADLGFTVEYQPPADVGADRLCDAAAAVHKYGAPCIVIDFGTATTFNAVAGPAAPGGLPRYLGGAICLGVGVSLQTLFASAAKIPRVEIARPPSAIGQNTAHALQSGIVHGALGQAERLVALFRAEMNAPDCPVVATGGHLASLLAAETSLPLRVEPTLTQDGLRLLYHRARPAVL